MQCDLCGEKIKGNPAFLISPSSDIVYSVKKFNLCKTCYNEIYEKIQK